MPAVHDGQLGVLNVLAETCISLPVVSREVPAQLRFHKGQSDALERLFTERIRHRWPVAIPDASRHASPGEAIREMLQDLSGGYAESTEFITPHLITFGEPLETDCGAMLDLHYAIELENNILYVRTLVERLEAVREGLGETVLAHLNNHSGGFIPGPLSDADMYSIFKEWRLQGYDDDAEARDYLEGEGLDEDDLQPLLPSVICSDLGGERFTNPEKRLSPRQLLLGLRKAGIGQAKELVQLLTDEMPRAREAARDKLMPLDNVYWPSEMVNIWITGAGKKRNSAIWGLVDDLHNNRMQMGDPDFAVAVNRVAVAHGYSRRSRRPRDPNKPLKGLDGLRPIALILRAWSALDRALVILNSYEGLT